MCEHIIGIYSNELNIFLVTIDELKSIIDWENRFFQYKDKLKINDFLDCRKTNLHRFDYCPLCGEKIDWKIMREKEGD